MRRPVDWVEAGDRRVRDTPGQRRFGNRGPIGPQPRCLELRRAPDRNEHFVLPAGPDGEQRHRAMHDHVHALRLEQPRHRQGRLARVDRGEHARQADPHERLVARGPLQRERTDEASTLGGHDHMHRVQLSRGRGRAAPLPGCAKSDCCTTTGAVAVSPLGPVACTVAWPMLKATTTPLGSTFAISGRNDFQVTATGAAGEPSSFRARGDGSQVLRRQQVDRGRLDPQHGGGPRSHGLSGQRGVAAARRSAAAPAWLTRHRPPGRRRSLCASPPVPRQSRPRSTSR